MDQTKIKAEIIDTLRDMSFRSRLLRQYKMASSLRPVPINERDEVVLQIITMIDHVTDGDLAPFGLSLSTVSEMVKRLVELGAVIKLDKGERDSRQKPLKLTDYGKELVEAVRSLVVDTASYLTKDFDDKELENALEVFKRMQKNAVAEMERTLISPLPKPPRENST